MIINGLRWCLENDWPSVFSSGAFVSVQILCTPLSSGDFFSWRHHLHASNSRSLESGHISSGVNFSLLDYTESFQV